MANSVALTNLDGSKGPRVKAFIFESHGIQLAAHRLWRGGNNFSNKLWCVSELKTGARFIGTAWDTREQAIKDAVRCLECMDRARVLELIDNLMQRSGAVACRTDTDN